DAAGPADRRAASPCRDNLLLGFIVVGPASCVSTRRIGIAVVVSRSDRQAVAVPQGACVEFSWPIAPTREPVAGIVGRRRGDGVPYTGPNIDVPTCACLGPAFL